MNRIYLRLLVVVGLFAAAAVVSHAQATRTWVSGVGDDVNPCSRTAPCKTFAGAISKTALNGEINCLDPAGYGAVNITKSITIDCTGTFGSILSAGTNGVIVNITNNVDTRRAVTLRGLHINGAGTGTNGIKVLSAAQVMIQNVNIGGSTLTGISIETAAPVKVLVTNSSVINNTSAGISAGGTGQSSIIVDRSTISGNGTGLTAGSGSTIRLSGSSVVHNVTGLASASGGKIVSLRNNLIDGNDTNGAPTSAIGIQ